MTQTYEAIRHRVVRVLHHIDRKRWDELPPLFAADVTTDYTSLFPGTPVTQPASALIAGWRQNLAHVVTQHLLGPIDVAPTVDGVLASCHVRALHYAAAAVSGSEWEVLGHYHFTLVQKGDGYLIQALTLETFHQTGNRQLLSEAQPKPG